jgi:phospho-N-acetylmuramoyl-pentapeptide-transferase
MKYFIAIGLPFIILMILGPIIIKFLKRFNFGQQIREDGPKSHLKKEGIPTMGGILIVLAILVTSFLLLDLNRNIIWALIITIGMGLIGFIDDYIKIRTKRSLGLKARFKILAQVSIGILAGYYIYYYFEVSEVIIVPFLGQVTIGKWILGLVALTVIGTANAVNLTDGLDGLAAGVTAVVASSFSVIASNLHLEQLSLFGLIVTGACIGFIWFNSHPAQVFMGDVGSLALGGAIASMAIFSRTELFLPIIGAVFVIETLSVMIQVVYFKLTGGKRVFNMTPIHHHYELEGLDESKIVVRFLILSILFASCGILIYYIS